MKRVKFGVGRGVSMHISDALRRVLSSLSCFFQHLFSKNVCTCTLSHSKSASPAYYNTNELPLWIHNMCLDISEAQTIRTACYYLLCLTFLTTYKNVLYYLLRSTTLMMETSNGNIFRVTGPLCGEFTGRR